MIRPLCAAALLFVAPTFAEDASHLPGKSQSVIDLVQWTGSLALVLLAIAGCALLLRRLSSFSRIPPGRLQVLASLSLGARERVALVQVGEKQLILGVAPGRVQTLCILRGSDIIQLQPGRGATVASGEAFADRLAAIMPGKRP